MDQQESFLRQQARSRLINNRMKKIRRMAKKDPASADICIEVCIKHWQEGNSAEVALRYMENEAKLYCTKLAETRF